ncbi:MAG: ATP-dependent helicase, partial [Sediminibacterium sp.]|nr:ATP-dependent helicase [Sediminibacterium sp.]
FISEAEQRKFAQIETLLGKQVDKLVVPEQFGAAPEYAPRSQKPMGNRRPNQGGGNRNNQRPNRPRPPRPSGE